MMTLTKNEFIEQVLDSVSQGKEKVLICGINHLGLILASKIKELGLGDRISGFYDPINLNSSIDISGFSRLQLEDLKLQAIDNVIITYDKEKELVLQELNLIGLKSNKIWIYGDKNYDFEDQLFDEIKSSLHVKSIAAGYPEMLIHIFQSILYIENNNIPGDILEFGTFRAGTTVFIGKLLKKLGSRRQIISYDTFDGFPEKKNLLDIFDDRKYINSDFQTVVNYCKGYNIELIRGDIIETIREFKSKPIALSFFDTDNYSATKMALEKVYPHISKNGILAFDHYYSKEWGNTVGERIAAKEYFKNKNVFNLHGNGIFIKIE